jgi:hypothetical protein
MQAGCFRVPPWKGSGRQGSGRTVADGRATGDGRGAGQAARASGMPGSSRKISENTRSASSYSPSFCRQVPRFVSSTPLARPRLASCAAAPQLAIAARYRFAAAANSLRLKRTEASFAIAFQRSPLSAETTSAAAGARAGAGTGADDAGAGAGDGAGAGAGDRPEAGAGGGAGGGAVDSSTGACVAGRHRALSSLFALPPARREASTARYAPTPAASDAHTSMATMASGVTTTTRVGSWSGRCSRRMTRGRGEGLLVLALLLVVLLPVPEAAGAIPCWAGGAAGWPFIWQGAVRPPTEVEENVCQQKQNCERESATLQYTGIAKYFAI